MLIYASSVHAGYAACRENIVRNPWTFLLLSSLDLESCVRETVRRQLRRPFSRSAEREEQVIRARFDLHRRLPVHKIETMCAADEVVRAMVSVIERQRPDGRLP